MAPEQYEKVERCVDDVLERLDGDIVLGTPLGIGEPNHLVNEFVRRALDDRGIELKIWTALSLTKMPWKNELERRLIEPPVERIFGDYPDPVYASMLEESTLPDNIDVHQFYYPPGAYLHSPQAQQKYHSVNYTHVLREIQDAGVNVIAQLVGEGTIDGEPYYNLSSNTDLSADLIPHVRERRTGGEDAVVLGQVNRNLPFMYGDAPIEPEKFDAIIDHPDYEFPLFGPPNLPVSLAEHAIGLRVSSLVRDGGTVQIGIGSLGDAIAWAMQLRHERNDDYTAALEALGALERDAALISDVGGTAPFDEGLYGGTEMFVEAFLHLLESGILDRQVYDDVAIQKLANRGVCSSDEIGGDALDALAEEGAIDRELGAEDVAYLKRYGVLAEEVEWREGRLVAGEREFSAEVAAVDDAFREHLFGDGLAGGKLLHAGFFLGPGSFYETLREMDDATRRKMGMKSVQFTNQLYGDEELHRLQRRDARFVNSAMKVTVSGAVVSDGLEDNRVVSGVGGQFNFVNMAHELEGGRSIIMIRATRTSDGEVESNIVWNYGHTTIPRHLRDIVVTEYGVADLRGRSDSEVIARMVEIADSRFQDDLVRRAKEAGKLSEDYEIPVAYRDNLPERLEEAIEGVRSRDLFPSFPYGTDLTETEYDLTRAFRGLKEKIAGHEWRDLADMRSIPKALSIPEAAQPYLERLDLVETSGAKELVMQRLAVYALAEAEIV